MDSQMHPARSDDPASGVTAGPLTTGALRGIRVIDLTTNISGPSSTAILGDLGADVVKVERIDRGDDARAMSPKWNGESVYFIAINRNKRSLALDFTQAKGTEILRQLIAKADVVVENFRRGTLEKYGLDAASLCRDNPRLVYCSLSSYGETGDDRFKPGYDAVLQARTGIMSITGSRADEPSRAGVSILDAGSAMWAGIAILSALYHRALTGRGQVVGTSLMETGVYWMNYHLTAYQATGQDPTPQGARHMAFAPYGAFQTADDFILVGISNDSLFERLVTAMGMPELAGDERFVHNSDRVKHRSELEEILTAEFREKTSSEWMECLDRAGVPCSPIQKVSGVLDDPQVRALGLLKQAPHPHIPDLNIPSIPVRMSETPADICRPAPGVGQHSKEILSEIGISEEAFEQLVREGIVGGLP